MHTSIDALDELAKPEHRRNPYPFLHWLREHDPVHRTRSGTYLLSNYHDVAHALQRRRAFAAPGQDAMWRELGHRRRSHPVARTLVTAFAARNDPRYSRLRSAIAGDMAPERLSRLRPRILEQLGNLFDDLGPRLVVGETVDLHAEVSVPLTRYLFADRAGVPEEDHTWIADTIASMRRAFLTDDEDAVLEADRASHAVQEYFRARIAERRSAPRDDLITRLVGAHNGEDELLVAILLIMWITGFESTISAVDRAVLAFLAHPEHRSWCGDDKTVGRFLDETLRHDGVLLYTPLSRVALDDVVLDGVTIPAGSSVRMVIAGANRDPRVFRDPDTFDPARDSRRTLSTGNCWGTALGRAEMAHVVTGLQQRFPTIVAAGDPAWSSAGTARRTVTALPARLARSA